MDFESLPDTVQALIRALRDEHLAEARAAWQAETELTDDQRASLDAFATATIDDITDTFVDLSVFGDDAEVKELLPHLWNEIRAKWRRCNDRMNYRVVVDGTVSQEMFQRGGFLSALLTRLEPFMDPSAVFWCRRMAGDLNAHQWSSVDANRESLAIVRDALNQRLQAVSVLRRIQREFTEADTDQDTLVLLDQLVNRVRDSLDEFDQAGTIDLGRALESTFANGLRGVPFAFDIANGLSGAELPMLPALAMCDVVDRWLHRLIQSAGQTAGPHVFEWAVTLDDDGKVVGVDLLDDLSSTVSLDGFVVDDLDLSLVDDPGGRRCLQVRRNHD